MKKQFIIPFEEIVGVENMLAAWRELLPGKRSRIDVQKFSFGLMDNILALHRSLANMAYWHGGYEAFNISDPKPRNIHKASVRDRLLHRAIYRKLYPFFKDTFIADSFSCQLTKGAHRALRRFKSFSYLASKNNTRTCHILKCDIKKFFANIDHAVLIDILEQYIPDKEVIWLLNRIINSFHLTPGIGLPLGNLTSQLFVNIYMNEFDQFVKHTLKAKYYLRYCDDFVILSDSQDNLTSLVPKISDFLRDRLKLQLHPNKVSIQTLVSGVDFLGWVHFPYHRVLRRSTRRRMFRKVIASPIKATMDSYLGLLKHGSARKLSREVIKEFYLNQHI